RTARTGWRRRSPPGSTPPGSPGSTSSVRSRASGGSTRRTSPARRSSSSSLPSRSTPSASWRRPRRSFAGISRARDWVPRSRGPSSPWPSSTSPVSRRTGGTGGRQRRRPRASSADPSCSSTPWSSSRSRLRGESLYYLGRYADALAEHTEGLRLARATGNEREAALGQARRARVLAMVGQVDEALAEGGDAARSLEKLGDLREASHAHLFLGVVTAESRTHASRFEEAIAEFAESTRLAEKAHDPRRVGWSLFNTADILRQAGRLEEASDYNRRSREFLDRVGDRFGLVQTMVISGKIALDGKEYDRAEADLLDAYRLVREL